MEINVTKNHLTGENTVMSTATVPADDLRHWAGLKVYDDGRKCVYAFNPPQVGCLDTAARVSVATPPCDDLVPPCF